MNSRYATGRYFESLTKNWLERNGYYCTRSAGSHGAFDLVAFPLVGASDLSLNNIHPFVIQLKAFDLKEKTKQQLVTFLWSKEFNLFRDLKFGCQVNKYVFIYNSKSVKTLPLVFEYTCEDKWFHVNDDSIKPQEGSLVGYKG